MATSPTTIFIVRVDFRNGQHLEFAYGEEHLGAAKACYETLRVASDANKSCEIFDDAGRAAVLAGKDIQAFQLVDLVREAQGLIAIVEVVNGVRRLNNLPGIGEMPSAGAPANGTGIQTGAIGSPEFSA